MSFIKGRSGCQLKACWHDRVLIQNSRFKELQKQCDQIQDQGSTGSLVISWKDEENNWYVVGAQLGDSRVMLT